MATSDQISRNVDPLVRDFVSAVVREETAQLEIEIDRLKTRIQEIKAENHHLKGRVEARINSMENTLSITPSSRRQLQRLVEMLQE